MTKKSSPEWINKWNLINSPFKDSALRSSPRWPSNQTWWTTTNQTRLPVDWATSCATTLGCVSPRSWTATARQTATTDRTSGTAATVQPTCSGTRSTARTLRPSRTIFPGALVVSTWKKQSQQSKDTQSLIDCLDFSFADYPLLNSTCQCKLYEIHCQFKGFVRVPVPLPGANITLLDLSGNQYPQLSRTFLSELPSAEKM